ncbi:unnamed protein product, partial [Amoebophrya sp. A120]
AVGTTRRTCARLPGLRSVRTPPELRSRGVTAIHYDEGAPAADFGSLKRLAPRKKCQGGADVVPACFLFPSLPRVGRGRRGRASLGQRGSAMLRRRESEAWAPMCCLSLLAPAPRRCSVGRAYCAGHSFRTLAPDHAARRQKPRRAAQGNWRAILKHFRGTPCVAFGDTLPVVQTWWLSSW